MSTTTRRAPVVPLRLHCPIEHLHTRRAVADATVAGRYTNAGLTLDLGLPPDWHDPRLPVDEEWRIEWSKLYVGLDCAHAYRESADARYLDAWQDLVSSWIDQVPVDFDDSDVTGRRLQNWIYAWEGFARAPHFAGLRPGFEERLLTSIADQTAHLRANVSPERNHRTLELYGLLVVALSLPVLDPDGELRSFAIEALTENLLRDILPDGVQRERSTHYHLIAMRSFVGAVENARRVGIEMPHDYLDRLGRAVDFGLHCHRPDGEIPALSDADGGSHAGVLLLAAEVLDRPDALFVATQGARGVAPAERHASFATGGYFVQRSGWGGPECAYADERFLIIDAGALGDGGHGHYDLLSVEASAAGRPLVMDPGRFTYSEAGEQNWRRHFKQTAAHSTVCVDGLDQQPYRRGRPQGPLAQANVIRRVGTDELDLICAEATSPAYDAVHRRSVIFVGGEYWLIADSLRAPTSHRYDVRYQLTPDAHGAARLDPSGVRTDHVSVLFDRAGPARLEEAWVAPEYGIRLPAPAVVASVQAADAEILSAIVPAAAGARPAIQLLGAGAAAVTGVGVASQFVDLVSWQDTPGSLALGPVSCEADLAWVRLGPDGAIVRALIHGEPTQLPEGRSACARRLPDGWVELVGAPA